MDEKCHDICISKTSLHLAEISFGWTEFWESCSCENKISLFPFISNVNDQSQVDDKSACNNEPEGLFIERFLSSISKKLKGGRYLCENLEKNEEIEAEIFVQQ